VTPFLTLDGFTALWDGAALTSAQQGQITLLLQVASNWIYNNGPFGPNLPATDPTAQLVTYEVVANCLRFARFAPLKEFNNTTAHRAESGTLDDPTTVLDFTDRHKLLLGITLRALPMSSCRPNDFDADDRHAGWPSRGMPVEPWNYGP
jgi:hypothetical protein